MTAPDRLVLTEALDRLGNYIATTARDWSAYHADAWIWGLFCGWDCETDHAHDNVCGGGTGSAAMDDMAGRHGWDTDTVTRLRRYRTVIRSVQENSL